jgi:hypothetical protein
MINRTHLYWLVVLVGKVKAELISYILTINYQVGTMILILVRSIIETCGGVRVHVLRASG